MSYVSLILKPTRLCNLRCVYCHDWRSGPNQTMDFLVLARTLSSALQDTEYTSVEFIWHGGEPTILPISFYQKALMIQSHFRRKKQFVMNVIQTNGTRLTKPWIEFLRDNQFTVGISLDGPPEIHNLSRRYASGRPSFEDIRSNITLLRKFKVPFSVLMVVDEAALELGPQRIFDFFLEMGIKNFGLLAATPLIQPSATPNTPALHYVDPTKMIKFLIHMFDIWKRHGDPSIKIRELQGIIQMIRNKSGNCTLAGGCFGHYYVVEPNGDVAHCELFQGDSRYTLGNILQNDFYEMRNGAALSLLTHQNKLQINRMKSCPEFSICNGWCPHERYLSARHNSNHNAECCGLRPLIEYIKHNMSD
jgi:uncharacterized protein